MFAQTQLTLPFQAKSALEELTTRHPYWEFAHYETKTQKVVEVTVQTPQFMPLFPIVCVRFAYATIGKPEQPIKLLDEQLKQAVNAQLDFARLFI